LQKQATPAYTDFLNSTESVKIGKGYGWGGSTTPYFTGLIDEIKKPITEELHIFINH
jgi:hypothetical protein